MICACLGWTLTIKLWTCDGDVWIKAEPVVNEGKSTCHTPEHTGSLAVSWTPSLARLWQKCNLSKKAWRDGQTRNARDHNRSISRLGWVVLWRLKAQRGDSAPSGGPLPRLTVSPLIFGSLPPGPVAAWCQHPSHPSHPPPAHSQLTHLHSQHPGCFLKLFFSLPLLLLHRTLICASKTRIWHSAKKYQNRIERFFDLIIL